MSKNTINNKAGTFTYRRGMRDGTSKEITALLNQSQRVRKGKTEKDKANTKKHKA